MTTVSSPSSSPVPVYNRGGVTIASVTADTTPVPIVRFAGTTVVIVNGGEDSSSKSVVLPSDAEVGDIVEMYADQATINFGGGFTFHVDSGSSILDLGAGGNPDVFCILRKVSATLWAVAAYT